MHPLAQLLIMVAGLTALGVFGLRQLSGLIRGRVELLPLWRGSGVLLGVSTYFSAHFLAFGLLRHFLTGNELDQYGVWPFLGTVSAGLGAIVLILLMFRMTWKTRIEHFGLHRRKPLSGVGVSLGMYIAFLPAYFALSYASQLLLDYLGAPVQHQQVVDEIRRANAQTLVMLGVSVVVIAPMVEELLFRGVVYKYLGMRLGTFWGVVLSAFVFALVHLTPSAIFPIFLLGLLLAYVYHRTKNLLAPIAVHAAHNLLQLVLTINEDALTEALSEKSAYIF